jgi:hypothetical protein
MLNRWAVAISVAKF